MNALQHRRMESLKTAWLDAEDADQQVAIDHEISERIGRETEADFQLGARVLRGAVAQSRAEGRASRRCRRAPALEAHAGQV